MAQATGSPEQMLRIDQVYLLGEKSEQLLKETGAWCIKEEVITQQYYDTTDYSLSLHATWLSCRNGEWKLLIGSQNIAQLEEDFIQSQGRASEMELAIDGEATDSADEAENNPMINPHRRYDDNTNDQESKNNDRGDTNKAFTDTAMTNVKGEQQEMPRADIAVDKSDDGKATKRRDDSEERVAGEERDGARAADHCDPRQCGKSRASDRTADKPYSYAEITEEGEIARYLGSIIGIGALEEKAEDPIDLATFLRRANVTAFSSNRRSERRVWRARGAYTVAVEEDELAGRRTARVSLTVPLSDIVSGFEQIDQLAAELGCEQLEKM